MTLYNYVKSTISTEQYVKSEMARIRSEKKVSASDQEYNTWKEEKESEEQLFQELFESVK